MSTNATDMLFVGSYAPENMPGIHVFKIDLATGELTPRGSYSGIAKPSFLTIHPNGEWLYSVSETGQDSDGVLGSVHSFRIQNDDLNLKLEPINQQSTDGDWPCHLQFDRSGRWLIASNYGTGNAALFPILSDGALGEMKSFVQHEGHGPNSARQEGPHAHSAIFTPDNRFVIVADLGIDQLVVYNFDDETGSLSRHTEIHTQPGAGPRHFAFHPNDRHLLVANELDSSVTVYEYDAENGTLHSRQTLPTLPTDSSKSIVADIHFSPAGQHVYVSNRGHDSLAIFEFNQGTGKLSALPHQKTHGKTPRNFAIDPKGVFLQTANQDSNNIATFRINESTGKLTFIRQITDIPKPVCLKIVTLK